MPMVRDRCYNILGEVHLILQYMYIYIYTYKYMLYLSIPKISNSQANSRQISFARGLVVVLGEYCRFWRSSGV